MDLSALDAAQQSGKTLHEARRVDPAKGGSLAHAEPPDAEVEERRACHLEMQAPLLDLDQVCDQPREQTLPFAANRLEVAEELFIGEVGELHRRFIPPRF